MRVKNALHGFPGTIEDMRDALSPSIRVEKQRTRFVQRCDLAVRLVIAICGTKTNAWLIISRNPPLAQPIEASLAKPDLNAPTSVSISASVIGVENTHAPELMMLQPSL